MNVSLHIARRYLFAKKSHNAINIISWISLVGVALGSMALVIVLSVFNGFNGVIESMYSGFNPQIKVTPADGRIFSADSIPLQELSEMDGVLNYSLVLESQALIRYKDKQSPCIIKGVDENFVKVSELDSTLRQGEWSLHRGYLPGAIMGYGLARSIGAGVKFVEPMLLYVPKRTGRVSLVNPAASFIQQRVYPNAIFLIGQPEIDENYMLLPLEKVRELLNFTNQLSAIEIKLTENANGFEVQKQIQELFGKEGFEVKNRNEQEANLFRMMKTEKWMVYLILTFILLIAAFNVVGTMSMLMLDKKNDMVTLRNMGANDRLIRSIFLVEGWMISMIGAILGLILGAVLSILQMQFGLVSMGYGFATDAYPVVIKISDFLIIFVTVTIIGFLVAYLPVRYIKFQ